VLLAASGTWLGRYGDPAAEVFETSHNMYIQLLSGLGLAGLGLWLAMAGRAGWVLWRRARDVASLPDAAWLLSLAAFHVYAFFQEMFYVPPVLFLLFLPLARAMALEGEGGGRGGRGRRMAAGAACLLAVAGTLSYAADVGLAGTAARLGLPGWRPGSEAVVFEGFYPPETIGGEVLRWSVGDAAIVLPPGGATLTLLAAAPGVAALFTDQGPLDVVALGGAPATRRYELPDLGDGRARTIFLVPSRTVVPQALSGAPDPRRLGVAVGVSR